MPLERVKQGYKDVSMSFKSNPLNDDLIGLKNESAIARSIRNIVFTLPGEQFFDSDFGSEVSASLFENVDEVSAVTIREEIEYSINQYEPRVNLINSFAAASLDLNEAWNLSWGEGIQFILVVAFVYWLKVQIDTRAGLGKKKRRELKQIIVEAIKEAKLD